MVIPLKLAYASKQKGFQAVILDCRSLGYGVESEKKPSELELVTVQATAGTIAGACSSIITTPIDTIKTRLQVNLILTANCTIVKVLHGSVP